MIDLHAVNSHVTLVSSLPCRNNALKRRGRETVISVYN
jgi:hypothetical protein